MIDLEYTEIDGLRYPNIEIGMEKIENEEVRHFEGAVSARA